MPKDKLILHPLKEIPGNQNATGFAQEMHALAKLIDGKVALEYPGYAFASPIAGGHYSEIWLSCFGNPKTEQEQAGLFRLMEALQEAISHGTRIVLVFNDPDFFTLSELYMPKAYWQYRLEIAFCGTMPWPEFVAKHMAPAKQGYWRPISNRWFNLPLWQAMYGRNPNWAGNLAWPNAKASPYDLLYVGYDRGNRQEQLEPYMNSLALCSATANIALPGAIRHTNLHKQPNISKLTCQAKASIVIGDASYAGLLPYPKRVLESIANGLLTFVSPKLDPDRAIFPQYPDLLYAQDGWHIKQVLGLDKAMLSELWLYQLSYLHEAYDNALRLQCTERQGTLIWRG